FVESLSFPAFMNQPALYHLPRLQIQHCHLLEARMKVTTDILHMRPPSSRALGLKQIEFTRDDLEAVVVIQSSDARRSAATKRESKNPENFYFIHAASGSSHHTSPALRQDPSSWF